ncbi:cob(I)yrinic acid a,c-diamide adenosyltransferase [Halonatronum saccharophilum]|uniref:cob(I)yrinic acid a,c-diamide adenosyltransferase n=1 Tax=Halonatronum saccharophilum TaxID=150060 RepID=UPI0004808A89|nr:cob(I)yrinic acid a,c-diamide adenosyltransferase [Halonatronum saccharophilum]
MNFENKLSKGLVQVYTGDGKGKTTAALGLALRAVGHNMKVEVVQYMKGSSYTGELFAVEKLSNFKIKQFGKGCSYAGLIRQGLIGCTGCGECFIRGSEKKEEHKRFVDWGYEYTKKVLKEGNADIVILDEINNALRYELLTVEEIIDLIELKGDKTELILTGRGIPNEILETANLVTEMKAIKHPYQEGIKSRRGIEY